MYKRSTIFKYHLYKVVLKVNAGTMLHPFVNSVNITYSNQIIYNTFPSRIKESNTTKWSEIFTWNIFHDYDTLNLQIMTAFHFILIYGFNSYYSAHIHCLLIFRYPVAKLENIILEGNHYLHTVTPTFRTSQQK